VKIAFDIRSQSHRISVGCFDFFTQNATGFEITRLSDATFTLSVDTRTFEEFGSDKPLFHAHWSASCFLIALNIATVGYFYWNESPSLHPIYRVQESSATESDQKTTWQQPPQELFTELRELSDLDVQNIIIIFGSLSQDRDSNSRIEYLKGLLHISASHVDVSFYREAFGNFYRCIESFITQRILQVKQLSNEVKDIQCGLKSLGCDDVLLAAFKEIYAIRSNQFAHAQKPQRPFEFDDVLKAKAFADLVMQKYYRAEAEKWRTSKH
jgi:hypothetical protein